MKRIQLDERDVGAISSDCHGNRDVEPNASDDANVEDIDSTSRQITLPQRIRRDGHLTLDDLIVFKSSFDGSRS